VAPVLLYNLLTFSLDPFWGAVLGRQNEVPTPTGLDFVVHAGAGLLLAPFVFRAWRAQWTLGRRLLVLLACLTLLAMFAPVPYQRRLGLGLWAELAMLAVASLDWMLARFPGWRVPALVLAALAFVPTNLASYGGMLSSAVSNAPYPVYVATRAEHAGAQELGAISGPMDVTLAALDTAYMLPPTISGRVALGHPHETLDFRQKQQVVDRFFSTPDATDRTAALRRLRATYLFFGPRERALARFDPRQDPLFEPVWQDPTATVALYRVRGAAPP
jgi:hypothetical protein